MAAPKAEAKDQCVKPARGIIAEPKAGATKEATDAATEGGVSVGVQVGKPAPDFEVSAFVGGGFKNVKLSDYRGNWVVVCFYPGDFTFV